MRFLGALSLLPLAPVFAPPRVYFSEIGSPGIWVAQDREGAVLICHHAVLFAM